MKTLLEISKEIGELLTKKNEAYGSSFDQSSKIFEILYPDGIQPQNYRDLLAITRVIDKLFRIATNKDAFSEDPWRDIAGYAILSLHAQQTPSSKPKDFEKLDFDDLEKIRSDDGTACYVRKKEKRDTKKSTDDTPKYILRGVVKNMAELHTAPTGSGSIYYVQEKKKFYVYGISEYGGRRNWKIFENGHGSFWDHEAWKDERMRRSDECEDPITDSAEQ